MKSSKLANEETEYLRLMLEAITGKKITFKTVKAITKPSKGKKKIAKYLKKEILKDTKPWDNYRVKP